MSEENNHQIDLSSFFRQSIVPKSLPQHLLQVNQNQVAGHAGFYSLEGIHKVCLKPFNIKCVRGRREHLFYQLMELYRPQNHSLHSEMSSNTNSTKKINLCYKFFQLLNLPGTTCNCIIEQQLFKSLSSYIPNFYHVRHIEKSDSDIEKDSHLQQQFHEAVYSGDLTCPCYGKDPKEKSSCSRDYSKINFLCLEDLTAHCRQPCIADIKIGPVTYDPMAIKEKVLEQSSKYRQLREFGFRILGMKVGSKVTDKSLGKALETAEQVFDALTSFFTPLSTLDKKRAIVERILFRLKGLIEVFSSKNDNQLKFYSSSILIVYDMSAVEDSLQTSDAQLEELSNSVRVNMIDFAHVFHVHQNSCKISSVVTNQESMDTNYMYGLERLTSFFVKLLEHLSESNSPSR